MTERPILFSAPPVLALRANRKTQTRRTRGLDKVNEAPDAWRLIGGHLSNIWEFVNIISGEIVSITCPYGVAGDRLWTREAFAFIDCWDRKEARMRAESERLFYKADHPEVSYPDSQDRASGWALSIHMPRWASRDTLEVVSARAERLHAITEEDISAEGVNETIVRSIIAPIALRANAKPEHWIGGYDQGFSFCRKCAEKMIRDLKKQSPAEEYYIDGGWATEWDSQAFCETCRCVLDNSFTTFACEQDLDHFAVNDWALSPLDCLSLKNILSAYGWIDSRHRDPAELLAPDIHRLGYQAFWDSINGKKLPWAKNPWVWRLEFRRLNAP